MFHDVSTMFRAVDLVGVVLNGMIGGYVARARRFDVVGFMLLAIVSALGGGVLRDVLLQAGRPMALTDYHYLVWALIGGGIAYVVHLRGRWWQVTMPVLDSLALGAWAATGTARSLQVGVHWLPALFLGLATAIGGGSIRDVAVGQVPSVFGGNRLAAVPALLAAAVVVVGTHGPRTPGHVLVLATALGAVLAWVANLLGWSIPVHGDPALRTVRERLRGQVRHPRDDNGQAPGGGVEDAPDTRGAGGVTPSAAPTGPDAPPG